MAHWTVGTESLWVEESQGREPALLFIHGNSMSAACWKRQIDAEELSGWHRITWDEALDLPLWRGGVQCIEGAGHSSQWERPGRSTSSCGTS